jgi:hypothetical protein
MITKEESEKAISLYRPIQLEVQKVIFLLEKAYERDDLLYCCNSPNGIIDDLELVDERFEQLINSLLSYEDDNNDGE